jgi:hypothetical protein
LSDNSRKEHTQGSRFLVAMATVTWTGFLA